MYLHGQRCYAHTDPNRRPPYDNIVDAYRDYPRQCKRKALKAIGQPASEDVATISVMLERLRNAVERRQGRTIEIAAVTVPHLLALYDEDISDAFQYIGLRYLRLELFHQLMYETRTAYAGYGFGLCSNYTDPPACQHEHEEMEWEVVMSVLYTRSALTVTHSIVHSEAYLWEPPYRHIEDFTLGLDAREDNPSEQYYWEAVRDRLRQLLVELANGAQPTKILLMGESVHNAQFQRILREVLDSTIETKPTLFQDDPVGVAAIGAAEIARRAPWGFNYTRSDQWK